MKKVLFTFLSLLFGLSVMAQERIQLRSTDKAECVKSDMTSLKASFSFSGLEAQELQSERGVFSTLTMPNTVIGGNEGDPQIPVVNELIAVPYGAMPSIRVTSYSSTDYDLEEYGIHRLSPRQPDLRKDQRPEDVPFVYNEAAYQARGLRSEPMVRVGVDGTLRGVQVGQMSIEPVSYDPVNNKIRVFNDIEVEVSFDGADARSTEDMLVKTYSPYFNSLYKQLFNGRAVLDVYDEHPDLWTAPVKMLVIANRMFESCIQDWLAWKTTKGIYVDVNYTDNIGTSASAIKSFIQTKYAQDAPTFLMIMGDKDQVAASATGSETSCVTDLYYSSVDGDQFVDMFHSRFPAETVAQMTAMLNKALEYEQYSMPDPSYLNNVLLIAGEDSGWGVTVGRPTIWYATNYYYNTAHGFDNVYEFSHGTYTNCYSYLDSGVGFVNYTAHGSNTSWAGPSFTVNNVNNLTNQHKYFLAMGNCCQAADWGINGTCFGEAMVRAANKGAYAYIGSCPSTYWMNDYYFGVGPTNRADGTMPTMAETGTGCYDAIWDDDAYNTVNAILYIGNLAGNAAQALGYTLHVNTLYYWQAYHVLGDGSIMPYRVQPTANEISHMAIFPIGMDTYEVSAVPGSYVAISKDGVLHGTALVGPTGTVQVPITPVTSSGDVTICVTAPNRIPYIQTVPTAALEGAYFSVDGYTPTSAHVGDDTDLSITFKNVGTETSIGNTYVTLTTNDPNVTVVSETGSFGALAPEATTTVNGFQFHINSGVADGTDVTLHYTAVNGDDTYEGDFSITANEAVLEYQNMVWDGGFVPGETLTVSAKFKNTGHYQATNAVATMSTTSNYISITNPTVTVGNIAVGQEVTCNFTITITASCPETAQLPVTFTLTADGGLTATGNETLKNSCMLYFDLADSYGDGWNGSTLTVSFDDGTESQTLTIQSGNSSASYEIEVVNGVHVTLTWSSGSQWDKECSFTVSYEGDLVIYQLLPNVSPSSGVLYEFDCNCAAASTVFNVTATSSNTNHGTVSGGGEFSFGQSCTVTATANEGYFFTGWTQNGEMVSGEAEYTFNVVSNMNLVANFIQAIEIGEGTTTNNYLPSYNYYKYSMTEQIYTVDEIGVAGTITSIAFYNEGAEKTRTYDFYLKATTKSSFSSKTDWVTVAASDKVFSGEVTMVANAWTIITFSTPFEYDGTSNLVLVVDDNTGKYTNSPHMACSVYNTNRTQSIYIYSDGTNYNPSSPTTSQSSNYATLSVKNHILLEIITSSVYTITATANPTEGGTVSGGDTFEEGESCTLTATSNTGYSFTNWTMDGNVVSTDATYTFTVTASGTYVANFTAIPQYTITIAPDDVEKGSVAFGSKDEEEELVYDFEDGTYQGWTLLKGNTGNSPNNWMHVTEYTQRDYTSGYGHEQTNGWMLSESYISAASSGAGTPVTPDNYLVSPQVRLGGSITFWVTDGNDEYGEEHFALLVSTEGNTSISDFTQIQEWTLLSKAPTGTRSFTDHVWYEYTIDLSSYSGMGYLAIRHFNCYDMWLIGLDDITITQPAVDDGSLGRTYYEGESCTVVATAAPNTDYHFANWTENGTATSSSATYTFTVTGDRSLVANFTQEVSQTVTLQSGWNWFSTNVEITLDNLKAALVEALPGTNITIKSKNNGSITYNGTTWRGQLTTLDVTQMYKISVSAACEITLEGTPVNPAAYPITIHNGANWIGFPLSESVSLSNTFTGFAVSGDVIKSKENGIATYNGTQWRGTFNTLVPGQGYIYKSSATEDRTFTFPASAK